MEKNLFKKMTLVITLICLCGFDVITAQITTLSGQNVCLKPSSVRFNAKPGLEDKKATNKNVNQTHKANASRTTHQVDLVLDFDAETQMVRGIELYSDEVTLHDYELGLDQFENGSNVLSIPEGTYDILVYFADVYFERFDLIRKRIVIREQVAIDHDMQLIFSPSEAKNHIHFQTVNLNGEPFYTDKYYLDQNENYTLLEKGNANDIYCYNHIFCEDYGIIFDSDSNFGWRIQWGDYYSYGEEFNDFYINDVSDRYFFYSFRTAFIDNEVYTSSYELQGASGDVTLTNDPSEFVLFEDPFIVSTSKDEELFRTCSLFLYHDLNPYPKSMDAHNPMREGDNIKYYLSAAIDNNNLGYVPVVIPAVSRLFIDDEDWSWYDYVLQGTHLVKSEGEIILGNNTHQALFQIEPSDELNEYGEYYKNYNWFWPTNPAFTYAADKKKEIYDNNCPIVVTRPFQLETTWAGQTLHVLVFDFEYFGRYGECNYDYKQNAQVNINVNGEDFYSGQGTLEAMMMGSLLDGTVDATISNEMVTVDDIAGANKVSLHYTAGDDDETPPTMTMLHFKDVNGEVTDRFATADKGVFELSAGDFNFYSIPSAIPFGMSTNGFYRYSPESVEVSYSSYCEDTWKELPVEDVPENYWPSMGWFYRGSLESVMGQSYEGWFDLKVKVTDAAGNWQEQVISPAFRIDNLAYSGIAESHASDNAREMVRYNLAGQRVGTEATGVVIVKMSDGTARKILVP